MRRDVRDESGDCDDEDQDGDGESETKARAVFQNLAEEGGDGRRVFIFRLTDQAAQAHIAQLAESHVDQRHESQRDEQQKRDAYLNFHNLIVKRE